MNYGRQPYGTAEDDAIKARALPDKYLAREYGRTVNAICKRRKRLSVRGSE